MTKPAKEPKRSPILMTWIDVLTVAEKRANHLCHDDKKKVIRALMVWWGISKEEL